jgi:hypothetical protein
MPQGPAELSDMGKMPMPHRTTVNREKRPLVEFAIAQAADRLI